MRSRSAKSTGPTGEKVRVEAPTKGELVEFVNAPGEVEPLNKVMISARVMARIVELPYEEGQAVTKGDAAANPPVAASVLVRLDDTDLRAGLRSTEARRAAQAAQIEVEKCRLDGQRAQMDRVKATLAKAGIDLRRTEELVKSKDLSQADLDTAKARFDELTAEQIAAERNLAAAEINIQVLEHNVESAEADIARARDAVAYCTIMSPIDGTVTRRISKVGELAVIGTTNSPGSTILEVADLSQMVLVCQVDESDIGAVEPGQKAAVRIHTYPGEDFTGTVQSVALTHDYATGGAKYFKTKILLDTNGRRIYSGLTADVDILTRHHDGIIKVPSQAVLGRPADDLPLAIRDNNPNVDMKKTTATVVYRLVDGKAVVTPVKVGASDATHTVVTAGLAETDKVIIGPYKILEGLAHDKAVRDEREVEAEEKAKKEAAAKGREGRSRGDGRKHGLGRRQVAASGRKVRCSSN